MNDGEAAPVIVGVDGSDTSLGALRWAVAECVRTGSPLHLVHAVPESAWYAAYEGALFGEENGRKRMHDLGEAAIAGARDVVRELAPQVDVATSLVDGSIVAHLHNLSARSRMVAIGSQHSGPIRDLVLGSHVMAIVHAAQCAVLVWRERPSPSADRRRIVVGFDGSAASEAALLTALDHAQSSETPLTVASFWPVSALVGVGYATTLVDWEAIRRDGLRWLETRCADACAKFPDVTVAFEYGDSAAARGLVDLSARAGLIVVGSRGLGEVSGVVRGSVSQNVVHHSRCPVLVVR